MIRARAAAGKNIRTAAVKTYNRNKKSLESISIRFPGYFYVLLLIFMEGGKRDGDLGSDAFTAFQPDLCMMLFADFPNNR